MQSRARSRSGRPRRGDPDYVYVPRGMTHKPCPGCGQTERARPTHEVCFTCRQKIKQYDELPATLDATVATQGKQPYFISQYRRHVVIPGLGPSPCVRDIWYPKHDAMADARLALARNAGDPMQPGLFPSKGECKLWTDYAGEPTRCATR